MMVFTVNGVPQTDSEYDEIILNSWVSVITDKLRGRLVAWGENVHMWYVPSNGDLIAIEHWV